MTPVVVVEYDPAWPHRLEELADAIRQALPGALIEHVGSTAVPGLPAKPVIDLDVVVAADEDLPPTIDALVRIGYAHEGDLGIPGREAFRWPTGTERHHLYVVGSGSRAHRDHVDFRDYLREHEEAAHAYGELKRELAAQHRENREAYAEGKVAFVESALAAARA